MVSVRHSVWTMISTVNVIVLKTYKLLRNGRSLGKGNRHFQSRQLSSGQQAQQSTDIELFGNSELLISEKSGFLDDFKVDEIILVGLQGQLEGVPDCGR